MIDPWQRNPRRRRRPTEQACALTTHLSNEGCSGGTQPRRPEKSEISRMKPAERPERSENLRNYNTPTQAGRST